MERWAKSGIGDEMNREKSIIDRMPVWIFVAVAYLLAGIACVVFKVEGVFFK
jgi:hypothetical protein